MDSVVFWFMKIPINTDIDGCARCIKAGYYKMGWTNFTREMGGAKDGFIATAIMEIRDEHDWEQETGCDACIGG